MKVYSMFLQSGQSWIKAYAKVQTSEGFVLDGFKVCEGKYGTFVAWPQREYVDKQTGEKKYFPVVNTTFKKESEDDDSKDEFRETVNTMVLDAYVIEMGKKGVSVSLDSDRPSKNWSKKNEVPDSEVVMEIDDSDWA